MDQLIKRLSLLLLLFLCSRIPYAQNLIRNGDFESYKHCPTFNDQLKSLNDWICPTTASPDFFHSCAPSLLDTFLSVSTPENLRGKQTPRSGLGYGGFIGLYGTRADWDLYGEYLQTKLDTSLKKGLEYSFEMYISHAEGALYALSDVGVFFSQDAPTSTNPNYLDYVPQISTNGFVSYQDGWVKVSGIYRALGTERYLTIGKFGIANNSRVLILPDHPIVRKTPWAYYYVDDVSLTIHCDLPKPLLPADMRFCADTFTPMALKALNEVNATYAWNTGDTTQSTVAKTPGQYILTAVSGLCTVTDTVQVTFNIDPKVKLGNDTVVCNADAILVASGTKGVPYRWNMDNSDTFAIVKKSGAYIVEVGVYGCSARDTQLVTILRTDSSSLGNDSIACEGPVILKAQDHPLLKYLWSTNDTTQAIAAPVSGKYWVKTYWQTCSGTDTIDITIEPRPVLDLGPDTIICKLPFTLLPAVALGSSLYRWSTGGSDTGLLISTVGMYSLMLGKPSCYATDTINVKLTAIPFFALGNDITTCTGTNVELKLPEQSQYSYLWSTYETSHSITVTTPGIYWGEVHWGACSRRSSISIKYIQTPEVNLGKDTALCLNKPFRLMAPPVMNTWQKQWTDRSSGPYFDVTFAGLNWLEIRNGPCIGFDSIRITQLPLPNIGLGNDRTVCRDTEVKLHVAGDTSALLTWNTGQQGPEIVTRAPGDYHVTAINSYGCSTIDTIRLDTFVSPSLYLGADTVLCADDSLIIDAGVFNGYTWHDGATQRSYIAGKTGVYAVTVTDPNGCITADSLHLTIYQKPLVKLPQRLQVCNPDTLIRAESDPGNNYLWSDGTSMAVNRVTSYGLFTVTVTDINQCSSSAVMEVINSCRGAVYVPNAFTPANADDLNEEFVAVTKNIQSIRMQVYTRWGELVFETTELHKGWNGTYRQKPAPQDVYIYRIIYTDIQDISSELTGNVTLLR